MMRQMKEKRDRIRTDRGEVYDVLDLIGIGYSSGISWAYQSQKMNEKTGT